MHPTLETWFFICAIIVAVSALMLALMLVIVAVMAMRTRKRLNALTERIEDDVLPTVKTVRALVEDTSPKVKLATDQMLEVSRTLRTQAMHVSDTLTDIVDKTHKQANRVDDALTLVMGGLGRAGGSVHRATGGSSRKMSAALTGLRVGMEVLRAGRKGKGAEKK